MIVGVDTGGTFTDAAREDGSIAKVPSRAEDPAAAVGEAIEAVGAVPARLLAHGTTVATNALLERKGAVVALYTTEGFADVIEIGRQNRPSLYDAAARRPEPLVPRDLRFEVPGRLDATGAEIVPVDAGAVLSAVPTKGVEVAAVCLLHADLNAAHERVVAEVLRGAGVEVVCSSGVSPEFREYERTVTTVIDAYLRPGCARYLTALGSLAGEVLVMGSAGGLLRLTEAAARPVALLLSGPAGGVRAAAAAAVAAGHPDAVTFDMGGTSTDVCLVLGGVPAPAGQRIVAGFPVRMPALDIHTIGAGGGSLAHLDAGGALVVGPESAGAVPGPASYGRGGRRPTVTDADVVCGRIDAGAGFPGIGTLDVDAARAAFVRAGVDPGGTLAVVDAAMVEAVRAVSVDRGVDPRRLALVAFGGAGPLHACAIADELGMPAVIVPARAGVLSAVGMLGSPPQVDLVRSWPHVADHHGLAGARAALGEEARQASTGGAALADVIVETSLDCRYQGQSHELTVESVAGFHAEHEARNGFRRGDAPVEVVAVRARATRPPLVAIGELPPAGDRRPVRGPTVVAEEDCTVWVPDGWRADVHDSGALVMTRG